MSAVANQTVFFSLRSKKCNTLYEIESKIKSLVNSNLNLNPLKRRNICARSNPKMVEVTRTSRKILKCSCEILKLYYSLYESY